MFNSTAQLLSDDQCKNGTGVSGVQIENVGASSQTQGGNGTAGETPKATGAAAGRVGPMVGTTLVAAVVAWGLL
jgi:hypothetical protein